MSLALAPNWTLDLISLGAEFSLLSSEQDVESLTLVLCLPRVDYAAAFLGLGILKSQLESNESQGERRMKDLLGRYVICQDGRNKTRLGFLEYCEINKDYKITEYSRKNTSFSWVLNNEDWQNVSPVGISFNRERRLNESQIKSVKAEAHSLFQINRHFNCSFSRSIFENPQCAFIVRGNKARISEEILSPLSICGNLALETVLRPKNETKYAESFHCSVESFRSTCDMQDDNSIVIIEASRNLSDDLVSFKKRNRIILLGRNSVSYDESSSLIMDTFYRRKTEKKLSIQATRSINALLFSMK